MSIFYSSDQHFHHSRILIYSNRDFKDVEEMNYEIIKRYNEVVKPEDTVYHLGDFTLNEKYVANILQQLNGTKHLIAGNHEVCFSAHKKHKKAIQRYLAYGFASVQERMELQIGNHTVMLSHLPFLNKEDKDQRYSQFRPENCGQFLLHGHIHQHRLIEGRMINVGVDVNNFYPVSEMQIAEWIADIIESEQV